MQQLNDTWMRVVGVPTLALMGQWTMYGYANMAYPDDWRIPVFFVLGSVLVWESSRRGIILSRRRYPELAQTWRRVLLQLIWFVACASLIRVAQTLIYQLAGLWQTGDQFQFRPYFFNTFVSVIGTVQLAAIFEGIYLYRSWQLSYAETQDLKKANLQSQLDSLKTQINPHFLFNNLNSLSALIVSEPEQAERFLDELSAVYRYLLQQNNHNLCPLSDELRFIQAYSHLIKTRFGDGIFVQVDVEPEYLPYLIAPLTLQLLFENAIKHNVISASRPLTIRLYTEAGRLYVSNNIQMKKIAVPSNKIGLQNIIMKYKLMDNATVEIYQDETTFVVTMPLIKPVAEVLSSFG